MADLSSMTVKFEIDGQIRRIPVPRSTLLALESLEQFLCDKVRNDFRGKRLSISWTDEDGDSISVESDAELKKAVDAQTSGVKSSLRFKVEAFSPQGASTSESPIPPSVEVEEVPQISSKLSSPLPFGDAHYDEQNGAHSSKASEKAAQLTSPERKKKPGIGKPNDNNAASTFSSVIQNDELNYLDLNVCFSVNFKKVTSVAPLQSLTKTWHVQNSGMAAWPPGCVLEPSGKLAGFTILSESKLPPLAPGKEANISVNLRAPEALGPAKIYFQAKTEDGRKIGSAIRFEVLVEEEGALNPSLAVQNVIIPSAPIIAQSKKKAEDNIPKLTFRSPTPDEGIIVFPLQQFNKTWILCNAGKTAWPPGCVLKPPTKFLALEEDGFVELPELAPGKEGSFSFDLCAPDKVGPTTISFRGHTNDKKIFGPPINLKIVVEDLSPDVVFDLQYKKELGKLAEFGFTNLDRNVLVTLIQKHLELPSILRNNIVDQDRMNSLMNELAALSS